MTKEEAPTMSAARIEYERLGVKLSEIRKAGDQQAVWACIAEMEAAHSKMSGEERARQHADWLAAHSGCKHCE